jgi:hypothetical protein
MFALHQFFTRASMQSLEFIILQFLVAVILPNNAVGTSDLPAVGAKKVVGGTGCQPVVSSKGGDAVAVVVVRHQFACHVAFRSPSRPTFLPQAAVQLSRRLRI